MVKKSFLTILLTFGLLTPAFADTSKKENKNIFELAGSAKYVKHSDSKVKQEGHMMGVEGRFLKHYDSILFVSSIEVYGGNFKTGKVFSGKDTKYRIEAGFMTNIAFTIPLNLEIGAGYSEKDYDSIARKMKAMYPYLSLFLPFQAGPFVIVPEMKGRIERGKTEKIDHEYKWHVGYEVGARIIERNGTGITKMSLYPFYLYEKVGSGKEKHAGVSIRISF